MKGPGLSQFVSKKRVVFFLGGLLLLVALAGSNHERLTRLFLEIGWAVFFVFLLHLVSHLFKALACRILFKPGRISFLKLVTLSLGRDAFNRISSFLPLRGDMIWIQKVGTPPSSPPSSEVLIVLRGLSWIVLGLAVFIELIVGFFFWDWGKIVSLLLAIFLFVFLFQICLRRDGFFTPFLSILRVAKAGCLSPAVAGRWEETDRFLKKFYQGRRGRIIFSLFPLVIAELCRLGGLYLLVTPLIDERAFPVALILCGLSPVIRFVFPRIPGAIGPLEGFSGLLMNSLVPSGFLIGLSVVLAERVAPFVATLVGFVFIGNPMKVKKA